MELAVQLIALCVLAPLHAEAIRHFANQEKPGHCSWIENELLPTTLEIIRQETFSTACWCSDPADVPIHRPYASIRPYAEIPSSTKLQFSTKSLLAPTQALFGKDRKNHFRSAFAPDGWDEQENEKLAELDEQSESIEFAFPQSKRFNQRSHSQQENFTFGGVSFLR